MATPQEILQSMIDSAPAKSADIASSIAAIDALIIKFIIRIFLTEIPTSFAASLLSAVASIAFPIFVLLNKTIIS